ncbi:Chaperone protein DnaJ [Streptomyces narbonensis]
MATDYYAVLGVRRDASQDEIKKAFRRLARELHPDVNPDPKTQERFKEINAAYEVLSDPQKKQVYDLGGDPLSASGGGGAGGFGAGGFGNFSDIMDAFFGTASQRGPRSRTRRGQDAMIRLEIDLNEAAFGTTKDIQVDTAVVCTTCSGEGAAPGTSAQTCDMCRGRGEVSQVTRSFLGQVMTSRPCPQCQGFGTVVPTPCPECAGDGRVRSRRTLTVKIPAGVDNGTRIQLAGEGEVGRRRRPRRRPVRHEDPEEEPRVTVVQALPKGDRGELAVETMTETGVDAIVPWAASRCITQWKGDRGLKALAKWRSTAREAGKQSRRTRFPEVADLMTTKQVAALLAAADFAGVLHEDRAHGSDALATVELPAKGSIVLVVGPEGGVSPDELAAFEAAGAKPYRLGRSVLRTSTAGTAATALVLARTGRWS